MMDVTDRLAPKRAPGGATTLIVQVVWALTLCAAIFGCYFGYLTISMASGAPQEAAGAAMALLVAVGPYVIARSLSEILR